MYASDLRCTDLSNANLREASLPSAFLFAANLRNADLRKANLFGAYLAAADLTGAKLEGTILEKIYYDTRTVWPDGFIPPKSIDEEMSERNEFIAYVGSPELHDAKIVSVEYRNNTARVQVHGSNNEVFTVEFSEVIEFQTVKPEGMMLYALAEMKAEPPQRCFVFANWNNEDKSELKIIAKDFYVLGKRKD